MSKILICVTGSIAAYKTADIVSKLSKKHEVTVVMTENSKQFITKKTFETLTGKKVYDNLFYEESKITHIELVKESDIILVAPATANIISKYSAGICDDLVSTILMVAPLSKVIVAPAMNTNMYNNPIIQKNIKILKENKVKFIEPRSSVLACNDEGIGALETVDKIIDYVNKEL